MVSGRTLRRDIDNARLVGVDEYVARPFDPEQIVRIVLALAAGAPGSLNETDALPQERSA
jgi:hypothetical protein